MEPPVSLQVPTRSSESLFRVRPRDRRTYIYTVLLHASIAVRSDLRLSVSTSDRRPAPDLIIVTTLSVLLWLLRQFESFRGRTSPKKLLSSCPRITCPDFIKNITEGPQSRKSDRVIR
eukprot:768028-Hanusia_phi.AAC.1